MVALELTNIKDFMSKLLKSETFDNFLLQEAVISNGATYTIDGRISKGFYSEDEMAELAILGYEILPYRLLRANCFDLIKGRKTPHSFKFIFLLSPENLTKTLAAADSSYSPADISGIFINLKYQNQLLTLTTGISYNIFSTDKSLENYWDKMIQKFLFQNEISFEELQ